MCIYYNNFLKIPNELSVRHVAIIMDGNGRWATRKGKLRIFGHKAGVQSLKKVVKFAVYHQLEALTLYAFSSENWNRPKTEVIALLNLFEWTLNANLIKLNKYNIKLHIIGKISSFNMQLQKIIGYAQSITRKNSGLVLTIAVNYGGRWDIIHAIKKIVILVQKKLIDPNRIDEDYLSKYLCLNKLAPVDFLIRTGGEYRLSNFLLWQIAYTELYFTNVLWPDFNANSFKQAITVFTKRERRFGSNRVSNPRDKKF
ncbi:MAG: polyprenyl diphosphate synthase [Candidatus Dasytiphilus stammeri]